MRDVDTRHLQSLEEYCSIRSDYSINSQIIAFIPPKYQGILQKHEMKQIQAAYAYMYPGLNITYTTCMNLQRSVSW